MKNFEKQKCFNNNNNNNNSNNNRIGLLNGNTHDSLQLWVSCLRTHQADLMKKDPIG